MKPSFLLLPVSIWVSGLVLSSSLLSQEIPAGHWQIAESLESESGKQSVEWAFELVDDGTSTLIAVGSRFEADGEPVKDRTVAILFIDRHDDGTFGGSLIKAFGDGDQVELLLDIDFTPDRRELSMAAFGRDGSITSKFKGQWLGSGLKSTVQSGTWEVREIVSPGKGSWDIQWKYQISEKSGKISGRGNKAIVNGRKSHKGEANTRCEIELNRIPENQNAIFGKGVETDYKGRKSRMSYEGWFSPSGRTFFMMSYESEELAALLVGRYAG